MPKIAKKVPHRETTIILIEHGQPVPGFEMFEDTIGFYINVSGKEVYRATNLLTETNFMLDIRNPEFGKIPRNLTVEHNGKAILLLNFGISDPIKQGINLTKIITVKLPNSVAPFGQIEYKKFGQDFRIKNTLSGDVFTIKPINFGLPYSMQILDSNDSIVGKMHGFGYSEKGLEFIKDYSIIFKQGIGGIDKALLLTTLITWAEKFRIKQKHNVLIQISLNSLVCIINFVIGLVIGGYFICSCGGFFNSSSATKGG